MLRAEVSTPEQISQSTMELRLDEGWWTAFGNRANEIKPVG